MPEPGAERCWHRVTGQRTECVRSGFRIAVMRKVFRSRQTRVISDVKENKQSMRTGFSGLYQGLSQSSLKSYPGKGGKRSCSHCSHPMLETRLADTIFLPELAHFPLLAT